MTQQVLEKKLLLKRRVGGSDQRGDVREFDDLDVTAPGKWLCPWRDPQSDGAVQLGRKISA